MRILLFVIIILISVSCGSGKRNGSDKAQDLSTITLLENVSRVMSDTTATPHEVSIAVIPLAERLADMATSSDKQVRINVMGLSQELLLDLAFKFDNLSKEESEEIHKVLGLLGEILDRWVPITGADGTITLTKEIVYISYQNSDERKEGYFTLQVTPPLSPDKEPYVKVTFPSTAIDAPSLIFSRYMASEEDMEENKQSRKQVEFDQWWGKDQLGEEIPLMALGGSNILQNMLEHDILYIGFVSEDLSETTKGEYEIARIRLKSFKEAYLKHEHDNLRSF